MVRKKYWCMARTCVELLYLYHKQGYESPMNWRAACEKGCAFGVTPQRALEKLWEYYPETRGMAIKPRR